MDKEGFKKQGRANRARGKAFELKVRANLEKDGWIVDKWTNQVVFGIKQGKKILKGEIKGQPSEGHLVPCKPHFNPFTKSLMMNSSGFPDFIAFKTSKENNSTDLIAVECKVGKYLSEEEKTKCDWLLKNRIFYKILIAHPGEKRGEVSYKEYSREIKE